MCHYCEKSDMAVPILAFGKEQLLSLVEPVTVRVSGKLMCCFIIVSHFSIIGHDL